MQPLPTSNGISYLPNEGGLLPKPPLRQRPYWATMLLFLAGFLTLHFLWQEAKGTAIERLWLDQITVNCAVSIVNLVSPETQAYAQGPRVRAAGGGGLNILNGCEGTDVLFLLSAAFIAFPMAWRRRALGLGLGIGLTFLLNEVRILVLFFTVRSDKALFDLLHTTVAPIVLIALIAAYFYTWAYRERALAETA